MRHRRTRAALLLALAAVGVLSITVYTIHRNTLSSDIPLEKLATCFSKNTNTTAVANPRCLQQTVRELLHTYSTATLLDAASTTTAPQVIYDNCHIIGHIIGRETFARSGSLENALALCSRACYYACTHGAIGAAVLSELGEEYDDEDIVHASGSEIERFGAKYCSDSVLCHGVGHLLYMSYQDFSKALLGCDNISTKPQSEYCYQGVFMEGLGMSQSLLLHTEKPAAQPLGDYTYPCTHIANSAAHACFLYLPLFQKYIFTERHIPATTAGLRIAENTCDTFNTKYRAYCFVGVGYRATEVFLATNEETYSFCDTFKSGSDSVWCTLGRTLQFTDRLTYSAAAEYCAQQGTDSMKTMCYRTLFQVMEGRYERVQGKDFCRSTEATHECVQEYNRYTQDKSSLPNYKESF